MEQSTGRSRWKLVQNAFEFREQGTHPIERWRVLQGIFNFSALDSKRNRKHKNNDVVIGWGTPDEVTELNSSVKDCLRIEGLNPDVYFTQEVSKFASVVEYYLDLHQRLAKQDIDLFVSLSGHLKVDHALVKAMKEAMDNPNYNGAPYDKELLNAPVPETTETRTPRTSTVMRNQETQTEDDLTPIINETTFGPENRVSSWVVRTTPFQPREDSANAAPPPTDEDAVHSDSSEALHQGHVVERSGPVVEETTPCVMGEESSEDAERMVSMPSRIWRGFKKRFCLHPQP